MAGGSSRRMGQDKALLAWSQTTLLDHTVERLSKVCDEVRILSGPTLRYLDRRVPVDTDVILDAGPLGGVYTGLLRVGDGCGLFLGVDLPAVPIPLLRRILHLGTDHDAVVPISTRGPQPLCAAYTRGCLPAIRAHLASKDFKMTGFWREVRLRILGEAELLEFGSPERIFSNVNTPEDYEAIKEP